MTDANFPKYEIMVILQPDLGEEKTNHALGELRELITEADGKVYNEDMWGLREMSYTIKHQTQGYYAVINFTADPSKVKEFEKQLNIHPSFLRYLITKVQKYAVIKTLAEYDAEAKEEAIKKEAEAKEKSDRGDRGGRDNRRSTNRFDKPVEHKRVEKVEEEKTVKKAHVAPKKEEVEEKKPVKKVKKEEPVIEEEEKPATKKPKVKTTTLEDVDAKLKSIIDDPDITL